MSRMMQSFIRIRLMAIAGLVILILGCTAATPKPSAPTTVPVTVLFFNDLHGHLKSFDISTPHGKKETGGIARMATLIRTIRKENQRRKTRTLVLVAGDILQGTPMSTVFKGEPDVKVLNAMGVDAMTVGNHEFDFGLENFHKLKTMADFPFLSANIIEKNTGRNLCPSSLAIALTGDLSITIVGVTTRDLLRTTKADNVASLKAVDPLTSVKPAYDRALEQGPVVILSHSRHQTDRAMAQALPEVAAIIGGHDQILLSPYRTVGSVPIFQAFEKGRYLGRIDLHIDPITKKARIVSHKYIPISPDIAPDRHVAKIVSAYNRRLDIQFKTVIGHAEVLLDGERERVRYEETALGNFIADIMVAHTAAQAAMINSGAIRASIHAGPVTVEDVFKVMPYANEIMLVNLSGAELAQVLARSVKSDRDEEDGGFLQVANLFFEIKNRRVQNIRIGKDKAPLEQNRTYAVAIPDFLASGGDGYGVFKSKPVVRTGLPLKELIVDTIKQRRKIFAVTEGRIKRLD